MNHKECAKRGAEFLDSESPGWADDILIENIDMRDCSICILGQRFGSYRTGYRELSLTWLSVQRYGFNVPILSSFFLYRNYSMLRDAWRPLIQERQTI